MINDYAGSNKFLNRIENEIKNKKTDIDFNILLPDAYHKKILKKNKNKINLARLDGIAHYKFTSENLINFIKLRYGKSLSNYLKKNFEIFILTKIFNQYLNRYNQFMLNNCDGLVFQSKLSYKFHQKFLKLHNKKYKIILNGKSNCIDASSSSIISENYPNLVITATFRPHKRLTDAIELTNYLKNKYPKIKLNIVGKIDIITKENIKKIDCNNCIFHGVKDQDYMDMLYKNSHIGISTSYLDPCPNSVVEMLSCGLPVITTTASGAFELVNQAQAFGVFEKYDLDYFELQSSNKIPKININEWVKKINNVLDNYEYYKNFSKHIFQNNLDINLISQKYINFAYEFKTKN